MSEEVMKVSRLLFGGVGPMPPPPQYFSSDMAVSYNQQATYITAS